MKSPEINPQGSLNGAMAPTAISQLSAYVVRMYSLVAVAAFTFFGLWHVVADTHSGLGALELIVGAIVLANAILLHVTDNVIVAKNILLMTLLLFMGAMLATGGTAGTGIFWLFIYPLGSFFLTGKREGFVWVGGLFLIIAAVWVLDAKELLTMPYDDMTVMQLTASLLVTTFGVFLFQHTRERLVQLSLQSRRELDAEKMRGDIIVRSLTEGIVATDAAGRVTFMNKSAQVLLGWSIHEMLAMRFVDKVPMLNERGNPVAAENRPLTITLKSAKPVTARASFGRKDGKYIPVSVTGTPMIVKGKIIGAISVFRDTREEEEIIHAKSEFVTIASHQLRTPISAVSWLSELLLSGDAGTLSEEQKTYINDIYHSNQRMAALIGEMLIVSNLDLKALSVMPERTDLADLASKVVNELKDIHKQRQPHIIEHYSKTLPKLKCDPDVMKLVLRNILSNAIKYSPVEGKINVDMVVDHARKVNPSSKGSIVITVRDAGYGIPKAATDKIFNKFFRAENILHKDTDGTGLGLYVVKSLLEYVGGDVSFVSEEGQGTVFTVLLPLEGMIKHETHVTETLREALIVNGGQASV